MRIRLLGLVFLAACGSSSSRTSTNPDAAGDGPVTSGDGGTRGVACGTGQAPCPATQYCDYADNVCGVSDTGACMPRPDVCPAVFGAPVCGCDGQVYASACTAARGGTDLNARGTCPPSAGRFDCGYDQCQIASEYCHHERKATGGDTYACAALPAACAGTPSCACLKSEACGTMCTGDPATGLTLTCPPEP
jgi:hypothetical protein